MAWETCDSCWKRPGKVRISEMIGPHWLGNGEKLEPWMFVFRRCQWCEAANTRWIKKINKPRVWMRKEGDR